MSSECFLCGQEVNRLYDHLFGRHDYTKEQLEKLKRTKAEMRKRGNADENSNIYSCENCEKDYSKKDSFLKHQRRCIQQETNEPERGSVDCPECGHTVRNLKELAMHCSSEHCTGTEAFNVSRLTFKDDIDFEEWLKCAQETSVSSFVVRSRKTTDDNTRVYYRCHRSGIAPLFAATTNTSKRTVRHCTAFINAKFTAAAIHIEYCLTHIGHEADASRLWLDKTDEELIVELLKEGFSYLQVKQKIREKFRSSQGSNGNEKRLFFITVGDVRAISKRHNLFPGRRHANDLISVEKRFKESNASDGLLFYAPSQDDTGDGFCLVIINELQRKWLAEFSRKGIGIDDTFNVTMYKLRLVTIIVADHCDRGLPAAFMLSFRMSEKELAILFTKVKEVLPSFEPQFFMSDDASSFYNAFKQVFPDACTRKILCNWHILQTFKRSARRKLTKLSLLGEFMTRIRFVCRSYNAELFTKRYSDTLTFLLNESQYELVDYLHQNWTHRIDEWSAQHRKGAVMNTSMMCERWHKHLKREVFRSKSKIRIDELVDSLIEVVKEMEEDSVVIERRGLIEGRYRLKNHLLSHSKAVSYYHESRDLIDVVQPGVWKIRAKKSDKLYMVEQERCPCEKVTNHCNKPGCSVCPYSFFCECNDDRRAGISCMHIHAVALYAPEGLLPSRETEEFPGPNDEISVATDNAHVLPPTSSTRQSDDSDQNRLDRNKELLQRIEMEYAGLHLKLRRIAAKPTREAEQCLNDALAAMKRSHTTLKSKLSTLAPPTRNEPIIATRSELPSCGPVPADAQPIRLKTTSSINKAKRKPSLAVPKEFASEDVRVCGFCFQENPFNDDCDIVYWLKCSSCNTWGHMGNCTVVSAKCTVCTKGTMEFSEQ